MPKPNLTAGRCDGGYENPPTAIYCQRCGNSLITIEEQSRMRELKERLSKVIVKHAANLDMQVPSGDF